MKRLRILFVCAMNKQRSLTAEHLYREDPRLEVRSAGVRSEAKRRVSESDLRWADVVFAMEREHKTWLTTRFEALKLPPIEILDIPDDYEYMAAALQEVLRFTVDPEIAAILAAEENSG
jgi:protein-tyrosine phosphatase